MSNAVSIADAAYELCVNRATLRRWIEKCPALRVASHRYPGQWFVDVPACKRFRAALLKADLEASKRKLLAARDQISAQIERYAAWIAEQNMLLQELKEQEAKP